MKIALFMALALASTVSFANGVEKVLPADASGVKVKNAQLAYLPSNPQPNSNQLEGYPDEATSSQTVLEVTFEYASASDADVPASGSGLDGQVLASDDTSPQFSVDFTVDAATIAKINAGKVNAADLISYSVQTEARTVQEPVAYHCQYISTNDNGDSVKADPSCQEASGDVVEQRPVVTVELK
jgi:hypothetical protein